MSKPITDPRTEFERRHFCPRCGKRGEEHREEWGTGERSMPLSLVLRCPICGIEWGKPFYEVVDWGKEAGGD